MTKLIVIKNLANKHIEEFKAEGKVLLTSFARCRVLEGHSGDPLEGIKGFQFSSGEFEPFHGEELERFAPHIRVSGTQKIKTLQVSYTIPDAYLFCTSSHTISSYESHYDIKNTLMFGKFVFESLRLIDSGVYCWKLDRVIYGGLKDLITNRKELEYIQSEEFKTARKDDYFCKPSSYKSDDEYRFVFFTTTNKLSEFTIVRNKSLIKYCTFD